MLYTIVIDICAYQSLSESCIFFLAQIPVLGPLFYPYINQNT